MNNYLTADDDFNFYIRSRPQIRYIAGRLARTCEDKAVYDTNPLFVIFEHKQSNDTGRALRQRRMATVGVENNAYMESPVFISADAGEPRPRFVQFKIDTSGFLLDVPTSTLDICEGERLVSQRPGYRTERRMVPAVGGGSMFSESLQRNFYLSAYRDKSATCDAAAFEAAWILFELWRIDANDRIQVNAFAKASALSSTDTL